MKKFLKEFKSFALKGSMIDLAVGMIIGSAFTGIVNSLVNDIVMPILSLITGRVDFNDLKLVLSSGENASSINYGTFLTQLVNFLLIALVVYFVVKQLNRVRELVSRKKEEKPAAPTEKECPYCRSKIPVLATRCPHCTSRLDESENP